MNVGGAVELDVVVVNLVAVVIGEHVVDVLVMVDDKGRNFEVLKNVGHNLGEVELRSVLESWEIDENGLAVASIGQ